MGRRARAKQITRKAIEVARALRNDDAEDVVAAVRSTIEHWRPEQGPLVLAPAQATASFLAMGVCLRSDIPQTDENLTDITSLLVESLIRTADGLKMAELEAFRAQFNLTVE